MPLSIPTEVQDMLAALVARTNTIEVHTSLDMVLGNGDTIHIATDDIPNVVTEEFGTVSYLNDLRQGGTQQESITLEVNRIDVKAQNVEGQLGDQVLGDVISLNGARGVLSYIFIADDGTPHQVPVLEGEISNASDQDPDISFQLVSYLSTDGPIGGHRTLQLYCFNRYKLEERCSSASPLNQGCDHTTNGPNGCDKHDPAPGLTTPVPSTNLPRHTGFPFKQEAVTGNEPKAAGGIVDQGGDFNTYWKDKASVGDYEGRNPLPSYLPL